MKLVESIMTRNPCYTAGRKITVKGLMLHSVGCPQPKASAFINSWNSPSHDTSCVHGFIDGNDGTVYQTLPWNHRGWHCGSGNKGSGNNTHIGVEMCEPACIKYTAGSNFTCSNLAEAKAVAKRTYEAAVELFACHGVQQGGHPLYFQERGGDKSVKRSLRLTGCRGLSFSPVFYGIFLQFDFSLGQNQKV